jgi:hypothetical protein
MDDSVNVGGRPTKRTAEVVDIIKRALKLGYSNEQAAKAAKIHVTTLQEWLKDDSFRKEIESEVMLRRLQRMEWIEERKVGWQSLAWMEERISIFEGDIRWIAPDLQIKCRLFEANKKEPASVRDEIKELLG